MKNLTFANEEIQKRTEFLKDLIKDGGRFQGAYLIGNTSVSLQPKKNGCPYGTKDDVRSTTEYNVLLNGTYVDRINKIRIKEEKEANFVPKKPWHIKIYDSKNGSIVAKRSEVENDLPITEVYLLCACGSAKSYDYTIQGKPATEQEVATIKYYKVNRSLQASKSQGVSEENAIIISTIASSNLIELRANNQVVKF
jgi:hypothetical protein